LFVKEDTSMARRFARTLGVGLLALAALSSTSRGSVLTYGSFAAGAPNPFPFGGFYQNGEGANRYQQVYDGTQFGSGVFAINSVTFFNSNAASTLADGNYIISLSTTSALVNGLSTKMATNVGPDNEAIFNGTLPATIAANARLTFALATPFVYNPANGNLLLDIQIRGVTNDSNGSFVTEYNFGTLSSRMVNGNAGGTAYGLMTRFDYGSTTVPEPGTLWIWAVIVVAAGGLARRRRKGA
jgi:MYXO-CTERM domain-containing protein